MLRPWPNSLLALLLPQDAGAVRDRRAVRQGTPARIRPAVPLRRRHDPRRESVPDRIECNALPWRYAAGTPNILGTIVSAQALRLLLDLALTPQRPAYFSTARPIELPAVYTAMDRIARWNRELTRRALDGLGAIGGITIYGPRDAARRTSLVAFNLAGRDPFSVAEALNRAGIESRAAATARPSPTTRST